jgi:hypothetical protein
VFGSSTVPPARRADRRNSGGKLPDVRGSHLVPRGRPPVRLPWVRDARHAEAAVPLAANLRE